MIGPDGGVGLGHLIRLTDDTSVFEHARGAIPRRDHGYCTDDAGRALALVVRSPDPAGTRLAETYLTFLAHLHLGSGRFALRMAFDRTITDGDTSDDACGRALHGLGIAASAATSSYLRDAARRLFDEGAGFRSPWRRAMAHAGVGAAAVLAVDPGDRRAHALARAAVSTVTLDPATSEWPESRLQYGNALLPDCLLAAGAAIGDEKAVATGLRMLRWLVAEETAPAGHFSFTPVGGRRPGQHGPMFDQQPIEAATMFEAASRARDLDDGGPWPAVAERAAGWLRGHNDLGVAMFDPETEGGYDGLCADGPNLNQGGESTIAMLSVLHRRDP